MVPKPLARVRVPKCYQKVVFYSILKNYLKKTEAAPVTGAQWSRGRH